MSGAAGLSDFSDFSGEAGLSLSCANTNGVEERMASRKVAQRTEEESFRKTDFDIGIRYMVALRCSDLQREAQVSESTPGRPNLWEAKAFPVIVWSSRKLRSVAFLGEKPRYPLLFGLHIYGKCAKPSGGGGRLAGRWQRAVQAEDRRMARCPPRGGWGRR